MDEALKKPAPDLEGYLHVQGVNFSRNSAQSGGGLHLEVHQAWQSEGKGFRRQHREVQPARQEVGVGERHAGPLPRTEAAVAREVGGVDANVCERSFDARYRGARCQPSWLDGQQRAHRERQR